VKLTAIEPKFVDYIPRELDEGVLYISEPFNVAVHKCASGCGEKVVTPLSPVEWRLKKEGQFVSLYPSIGNWNYECRSHYWIRKNEVIWAEPFSDAQIERVQARDREDKSKYIARMNAGKQVEQVADGHAGVWREIQRWLRKVLRCRDGGRER
jgi:hypothetical protein